MSKSRNANLDLLRAAAILMVLVHHVARMWPRTLGWAQDFNFGAYGVILFFVLSGWLIGTAFWKELSATGEVRLGRFVARRLLRTIPCYLVALGLSWAALWIGDPMRAHWDWGYLVFIQNFYPWMPYFLVSWSLCVEEHFYLVVPALLWLMSQKCPRCVPWIALLCLVPVGCRLLIPAAEVEGFAFAWTATHLRFEGLLAGFLVAGVKCFKPMLWSWLVRCSLPVACLTPVVAAVLDYRSEVWFYRVGLVLLAAGFLAWVVYLVDRPPGRIARHSWTRGIAVSSYSTYLVHALMIHVGRAIMDFFDLGSDALRVVVFAAVIAAGAFLFYHLVEKVSLIARDMIVPDGRSHRTLTS